MEAHISLRVTNEFKAELEAEADGALSDYIREILNNRQVADQETGPDATEIKETIDSNTDQLAALRTEIWALKQTNLPGSEKHAIRTVDSLDQQVIVSRLEEIFGDLEPERLTEQLIADISPLVAEIGIESTQSDVLSILSATIERLQEQGAVRWRTEIYQDVSTQNHAPDPTYPLVQVFWILATCIWPYEFVDIIADGDDIRIEWVG